MFVQEGEEGLGRDIQENWKFIVGRILVPQRTIAILSVIQFIIGELHNFILLFFSRYSITVIS